jgi:hypothetical protein
MNTVSGRMVDLLDPTPEMICMEDIAHHLSMLCRYNGATRDFYSVAEHSVHLSRLVPEEYALWALLHDASEAYTGDYISMMKRRDPWFQSVENRLMEVIAEKFNLTTYTKPEPELSQGWSAAETDFDPVPETVKEADKRLCATEISILYAHPESVAAMAHWEQYREPWLRTALSLTMTPRLAKRRFLERYRDLLSPEHEATAAAGRRAEP